MAPEEIERKSYYLSVDIWSIGILMYMLLNKGEHPFYHENDTKEIFLKNLKENKKIEFNNKISFMAMHLIKKLLEHDPIKRYKASDALKHPWITRNPEDKIPQTFNEQLDTFSMFDNAKRLMMISIFLNYFKKNFCTSKKSKLDWGLKNKKCKSTIYRIDEEYIKRCEFFNKTKRDKLKKLRGEYLHVKKDIDKSEEKNNNNSDNNTNSTSNNNISNSGSSNSNNYYLMKHKK
jgi:serine/threonine protein kinase